jgi:hypothetical protein
MLAWYEHQESTYMIMEYFQGDTLFNYVLKSQQDPSAQSKENLLAET